MTIALDTSVAIPLLVKTHKAHRDVVSWWGGRDIALCGHALAETYSVLTRLPGDLRLAPSDASRLISARFSTPLTLSAKTARRVAEILGTAGIAGGAVYDALVALAAIDHRCALATRDARAKATYDLIGVNVEIAS